MTALGDDPDMRYPLTVVDGRFRFLGGVGISRVVSVLVAVLFVGTGVTAFQIEPEVVTRVSTADTGIWIPASLSGEIVRVDALRGEVSARVAVADPGADLETVEMGGRVVVLNRTSGVVSLVDPALHEVIREVTTLEGGIDMFDFGPEAIIVAAGSEMAVIDPEVTASSSLQLGVEIGSIAVMGAGGVAATETELIPFDGAGLGDAISRARVRVVGVGDLVLELDGRMVREFGGDQRACLAKSLSADAIVVGDSSGLVVGVDRGLVQLANLESEQCTTVRLAGSEAVLGRPAVAGGSIFVPEPEIGAVHIVDVSDRDFTSHRAAFGMTDLRVRSRGGIVVAYATDSSLATLLDSNGVVKTFDTAPSTGAVGVAVGEDGSSAVVGGDDEAVAVGLDGAEGDHVGADLLVIDAAVLAASITNPEEVEPVDQVPEEPEEVAPDELAASYAVSEATVPVGTEVRFVDESTGSPDSWIWDFGDGTGAEGPQVSHAWQAAGTYPVTLHIGRGELSDEVTLVVTVVPADTAVPPSADFVFSSAIVEVGDAIDFEDRSRGEIERWHWDFGDGTSSTRRNVRKVWDRAGRYTVVLTVSNPQGSDSATIVVEVRDGLLPPVAIVQASTRVAEVGQPIVFTAASASDPATFSWDFGDGRSASGAEVTQVFLSVGTYTVKVVATNNAGVSEAFIEITVEPPTTAPSARIATLPTMIEVGDAVSLTSISSNGPDTEEWSFGDGQTAVGTTVDHTWTSPGTFIVTLTATNRAGSSTTTAIVEVVPLLPSPIAVISAHDPTPWVGEPTAFSQSSLDATDWLWDFGDGGTSSSPTPLHTFSSAGPRTVTLTVTNRNGTHSTSVTVEPRLKPTANFSASPLAPRVGEAVTFTDLSVNAASWSWDFGDGATSTAQSPQHAYSSSGSYQVVLTVTSSAGDLDASLPSQVSVDPARPKLSGIDVVSPATTLATTTFTAITGGASGPITAYEIDFGDITPVLGAVSSSFTHSYATAGTYTVQMRAQGPLLDWSPWVSILLDVVDPALPQIAIAATVPGSAPLGFVTLTGEELIGSGPINSWSWEIVGTSGTVPVSGREVIHNFTDPGTYTLNLTATGPVAGVSVSKQIIITPPPAPTITTLVATPSPVTTGTVVEFVPTTTGSIVLWEWDYEDLGTYVVGASPGQHIFNLAGSHTVWLRVTGPYGQTASASVVVTAYAPPSPSAPVASPVQAVYTTGDTVGFTSSEIYGATVSQWDWSITDGFSIYPYTTVLPSISHQFNTAGSWTVTVTATGPSGAQASNSTVVTVQDPPPPVASFTFVVGAGLSVDFTDTSTGSTADGWAWDFGDALGTSSVQNPSYTYAVAGTYSVSLTVTSGGQTSSPSSNPVTVS